MNELLKEMKKIKFTSATTIRPIEFRKYMNDKDKRAFNEWFSTWNKAEFPGLCFSAWQAALEYERNIGQRVYELFNKNIDELDDEILKLQAENKKLREALEYLNTITVLPEKVKPVIREALKETGE